MKRIARNTLTGWAVALIGLYWIVGYTFPQDVFAVAVRLGVLASGIATLWKWGPSAFYLLRQKESPAEIKGDILSLLGIATLSLGIVWTGVWGLVWLAAGSPAHWLSTPHSLFGLAAIGLGEVLLYRSTDMKRDHVQPVNWKAAVFLGAVLLLVGILIGRATKPDDGAIVPVGFVDVLPPCRTEAPIKGNVSRNGALLYHMPAGPWYAVTKAERCFKSEEEAREAGFRPAQ